MRSTTFRRSTLSVLAAAMLLGLAGQAPAAEASPTNRVIVQLKPATPSAIKQTLDADRTRALGARVGLSLTTRRGPAPDMAVVSAEGVDAAELAARLAAQPDVAFAVPDRRKQIRALPNDPLYPQQWHLQNVQPSAIDAQGAWDLATGSPGVVVAVVDTGVRFEHEDLQGRLLSGYDFVAEVQAAGDGNGRDADPTDPGDFLTAEDLAQEFFAGCSVSPTTSSWHGTQVSGVAAAAGNNSRGVAGVSWAGRILPVRALGKCGGLDSDILAAMRWAGGLAVPGVPNNPNPARIVNLSLGVEGECSAAYVQTVAELRAAGVLVVAASGNSGWAIEEPANCPGVFTVVGLRHTGIKVGYSTFGAEADVAAPAGNCGSDEGPCEFQLTTTTNLGATTPGSSGYSDQNNATIGTSFAAPLASGTAALMLSVHPQLGVDALEERLRASARAFPQQEGLPVCPQVDIVSGQCNCTTETCGAGMLDARAAVLQALRPHAAFSQASAAGVVTLDGSSSSASAGRDVAAWQWSQVSGPAQTSFAQPLSPSSTFHAPIAGLYRVSLTVTDSAGQTDVRTQDVVVSTDSTSDPVVEPTDPSSGGGNTGGGKKSGGGGGGAADPLTLLGLLFLAVLAYVGRRSRSAMADRVPPR